MYIPFVYIVKFTDPSNGILRYYIGSKYARGCNPSMLWTSYFTSSRKIHKLIKDHGQQLFEVRVAKLFSTKDEALAYEEKLIRRCIRFGLKLHHALVNGNIPHKGIPLTIGCPPPNKGKRYEDYLTAERSEEIKFQLRKPKTKESILKMVQTRKENQSYRVGADHPRAKKFILISPTGETFLINGNLKPICESKGLSWQALRHVTDMGPVILDRTRHKNLTRCGHKFFNSIGWELKSA